MEATLEKTTNRISIFAMPGIDNYQAIKNIETQNSKPEENTDKQDVNSISIRILKSNKNYEGIKNAQDYIFNHVCNLYYMNPVEVKSCDKITKRKYVIIRQICITLFNLSLNLSQELSAQYFGKDHATAIHSIDTVNNLLKTDKIFREKVGYLFDNITFPVSKKYKS